MSEEKSKVITRFAPSPTGALHIGGARTALFAWAYAKRHGGQFIIRMEDTDQARSSSAATKSILADLRWLGLSWDAGPPCPDDWHDALLPGFDPEAADKQVGDTGPYFQSQRLDIYKTYVDKLREKGLVYDDDGAVRMRIDEDVVFTDEVFGKVEVKAADLEDFVVMKSDGFPTFHLAVVVDDALMGVTHILRGQEHLSNTPKHIALQRALGFDTPSYAHMPSIMNTDGSKMSKRDKAKTARKAAADSKSDAATLADRMDADRAAVAEFMDKKSDDIGIATSIAHLLDVQLPEIDVADFRHSGYLPAVLCNYLALLGWNPGNDVERFDMAFLCEHFGTERIGKGNSKFDRQKLFRFNADTIAGLPAEEFESLLKGHFSAYHHGAFEKLAANESHFKKFALAYQPRSRTLDEPATLGGFFVKPADQIEFDEKSVKKVLHKNDGEGLTVLGALAEELAAADNWQAEPIENTVKGFAEQRELGLGKVAQPLRVAVTGSSVSPAIGDTLAILGRDETLRRIERCIEMCQPTGE